MKNRIFDTDVQRYDGWFEDNEFIFDSEVRAIRSLFPASGEGIEIGVGTGRFSSRLGIKVGVEPSREMAIKAVERGIDVIISFAEEMPIEDEKYDFALMVTVDCFLDDMHRAFREVRRILSGNGCFLIAFIDINAPLGKVYNEKKQYNEFYRSADFHSADEIQRALADAGFKIKDKRQTVFSFDNVPHKVKSGTGEGVFAVIKAEKL
jgi:SAM-dependent methyltransferase